jgi:transcriptional regulator with XRE-family HTH domain
MGLKELRTKRGLTQRELAEKVGMSGGNISDIESGRRSEANLTLATAIKLCDALKVRNPRKLLDSDSETSADSK